MKKFYILFLFCFLFSCTKTEKKIKSKNNNFDSISFYFKNCEDINLSDSIKEQYYKKCLNLIYRKKNDSLNRSILFQISLLYYKSQKWEEFKKTSNLLLQNSFESKDSLNIAQVYRYKAGFHKNNQNNDSAFYYYLKAENYFRKLKDNINLGNVLNNKSIIQYNIGDYVGADHSLNKAYSLLKESKDYQKIFNVLNMTGVISNETKDYNNAIKYYKLALKLVDEKNLNSSEHERATCLNNIGYAYQNIGNYIQAINNYQIALKDDKIQAESPDLYSLLIDNLAYSKFKLKKLDDLPYMFFESLKIREKIKSSTLIVLSKIHISEFYYYKKDTFLSKKYAKEALLEAKSSNITRDILASLKQFSVVDISNSHLYSQEYIKVSDSIQLVERNSQEKFNRLQLETDEIIKEKDELEGDNRNYLYYLLAMFIASLTIFIARSQITKNRILTLEKAQQQANEDILKLIISQQNQLQDGRVLEKQRISKELHDGVLGRMFGLRLNLDGLNKYDDEGSKVLRLEYINELKVIEQDIREISHELSRENTVIINNFMAILNNLFVSQRSVNPAKLEIKIDDTIDWDHASSVVKINFYRIVQESLQNINKYAEAKTIKLDIAVNEDKIMTFTLLDDGVGFDTEASKEGIGVKNMLARVKECNGSIDIKSEINNGTSTTVIIPLDGVKQKNK